MCNLGEGIYEQGIACGIERGIEQGMARGIEQGIARGIERGKIEAIISLVKDDDLDIKKAAEKLNISVEEVERLVAL